MHICLDLDHSTSFTSIETSECASSAPITPGISSVPVESQQDPYPPKSGPKSDEVEQLKCSTRKMGILV